MSHHIKPDWLQDQLGVPVVEAIGAPIRMAALLAGLGLKRAASLGNVSRLREPDYAVALCEAYNDNVKDHYTKTSAAPESLALIPPQDPARAAIELRRAVRDLGCRAAVVRTTG